MIAAALAQLRLAASLVYGRPIPAWALDRLVVAARDTVHEFGQIAPDGGQSLSGPSLDKGTRREMQLRRFRHQAKRAATGTAFYATWFSDRALDPATLTFDDIARLPLTKKGALRDNPDAFVHRDARPIHRSTTTGTTGRPTQVSFSARELHAITRFSALGNLIGDQIRPEDIVLNAMSSRASLGNLSLAGACAQIGALLQPVGLIDPRQTLALIVQPVRMPGRVPKVSVLSTYASYLGVLVELGLAAGYRPGDFALRWISVGGEVVTDGLVRRARRLFGEGVRIDTGYAMTETYPFAGMPCEQGHLHFEPSHGLVEVLDSETGTACQPGRAGTLVVTPFSPFRETTLLLRYDTQDVVRAVAEPLNCRHRHLPATGNLLGKLNLSVRHGHGWTYPADVIGALEEVEAVPLPGRCGFWAEPGGVALEVVVRKDTPETRLMVEQALERHGVPLVGLRLVTDPDELRQPFPLRCDLHELGFRQSEPTLGEVGR